MRNLPLIVLVLSLQWEDYVLGRSILIEDGDQQNIFGHLCLLDSSTGHSQRLKRRHVEPPRESIHRVRLNLSSVDKVIDMDLQAGCVWDSSSDVLLRHGEEVETFLPTVEPNCYFSGRIRTGHGYASFSFCNGVNGVIHTNNESYIIEHAPHNPVDVTSNDIDADLPSVVVKITRDDDVQSSTTEDANIDQVEELEDVEDDVFDDDNNDPTTTELPSVDTTTPDDETHSSSAKPNTGRGKATIEVGIYINANYTNILKSMQKNTTSQIVDWVINRWNIIRHVYQNTSRIGAEVDVKIKRLEIWSQNPAYFGSPQAKQTIRTHLYAFCKHSPEDGVDHKMMYTWETGRKVVGLAYVGGVCGAKTKCAVVMPQKHGVQRELHELGHNLGLPHDPKIRNCTWPYGFMGWKNTTEFKDCYRPVILASLAQRSKRCLYTSRNSTGQVSLYSGDKLVPADQLLSSVLDKW